MRVMEDNAILGFLNRRFGIPILCGGTVRLPALIGYARAMEVIITGRPITANEAFQWGLINKNTAPGTGRVLYSTVNNKMCNINVLKYKNILLLTALGTAVNFAKSIIKFPRRSLLADRISAHFATFSAKQLEEALQFEKDNASHLLFEEGVKGAKQFTSGLGKHGKFNNITPIKRNFKEFDKDLL